MGSDDAIEEIEIRDEVIRLGQLLKLASLVEDGAAAKRAIEEGLVRVDGDIVTARGAQLRSGAVIELEGRTIRIQGPGFRDG